MINSATVRQKSTASGYLLKLADTYYCNRRNVDYNGFDWALYSFDISGMSADGGAKRNATIKLNDKDRLWENNIDANGLESLTVDIYQMYETHDVNEFELLFKGGVVGASKADMTLTLSLLGAKSDLSVSPRNRLISDFSNIQAGSTIQIGDEIVRIDS